MPLPATIPDNGEVIVKIDSCDPETEKVTLSALDEKATGSIRNCSAKGCLFGAPLPIPNTFSPPTSTCVQNLVATDAVGDATCPTGETNLNLPLTSEIFLTGDLLPNVDGIQPCPLCTGAAGSATCKGGPNDGLACVPGSSALTDAFPTSQDCPPPPATDIGGLPIGFNLTSGSQQKVAQAIGGQARVFCGFCRDVDDTLCFEGDQASQCPKPAGTLHACSSDDDCGGTFESCQQANNGAFSKGGGATISLTGAAAGDLRDGQPHAAKLVSAFCIPPTFNSTVDAAANLPGPGAAALAGDAQLLP